MALILPRSYHKIAAVERNHISWIEPDLAERQDIRPLRIGILNIMPLGKQYEFNLLHPLGLSPLQIEPIWIRLKSHNYKTLQELCFQSLVQDKYFCQMVTKMTEDTHMS